MSIQHGARVSSSEGLLGLDTYASWRDKMTASLAVHEIWDLVNSDRVKPTILVAIQNAANSVKKVSIDLATAELKAYMKDYRFATSHLLHSIFDS